MPQSQREKIAAANTKPVPTEKRCPKCDSVKPAGEFRRRRADGSQRRSLRSYCTPCERAYGAQKAKRARDRWGPERRAKAARDNRAFVLMRDYGLTLEDFEALLAQQGGTCAICDAPPPSSGRRTNLAVDHDHDTGEVRGLLCDACNWGLGTFSDSPTRLRAAANYLEQTRQVGR